ncbi:MAG: TetR/AcrR family transcriptional regulator [Actinomycetota bacterium]|nr:TetR/AcrR family transcriptional regulator [Actinomycetota bacterium]
MSADEHGVRMSGRTYPIARPSSTASPKAAAPGTPRKDVARNRARLLTAADELVAEQGLDVSFNELARRAGVGVGTVYRHFTDREALIAAMLEQRVGVIAGILRAATAADDPVASFREAVFDVCELQAGDRGMWEAIGRSGPQNIRSAREQLLPATEQLVQRAQATGRFRPDFAATDLAMLFWISGAVSGLTRTVAPGTWRRYVEIILDGLTIRPDTKPLSVPALTTEAMQDVLAAWRPDRGARS